MSKITNNLRGMKAVDRVLDNQRQPTKSRLLKAVAEEIALTSNRPLRVERFVDGVRLTSENQIILYAPDAFVEREVDGGKQRWTVGPSNEILAAQFAGYAQETNTDIFVSRQKAPQEAVAILEAAKRAVG